METPRPDSEVAIYSDTYKDIYFCEEDGLAEGDHVFLKGNTLPERWADRESFVIAETGFGTGLNFLAAWLAWERTATPEQHLTYISFEKFPLTPDQIRTALSRWANEIGDKLEVMLENYPIRVSAWHNIVINKNITLLLIFDDVNRALPELDTHVDAWFLDGFTPAKNPEMWSETVFRAIAQNSYEGTTVASFTAAGIVKRGLREVGFHIAKTRGYGRKRDMIYGHFLPETKKPERFEIKSVAVIGGGLAGTNIADKLSGKGLQVDLYEEKKIGAGASGNTRGLFNPRFTSQRGPVSDFYASAYALAVRKFKSLQDIGFNPCGSVHLLTDEDKKKRVIGAVHSWGWHSDHMRMVEAEEACGITGVRITSSAVFLADAGFVSPEKLCKVLAENITVLFEKAGPLTMINNKWIVSGRKYDAVVIASGAGVMEFAQLDYIPFSTVRGQIAVAPETEATKKMKTNICYGGYCSPADDGEHVIGSTFQPWLTDTEIRQEDNADIRSNFENHVPALSGEMDITAARAALRVATKDRFPVVGRVPAYDNLYISAGHGSHGLISSALAAEIIMADIAGRVTPVPKSVLKELSPQRFIDRAAKK